jgi:hypothetical protein
MPAHYIENYFINKGRFLYADFKHETCTAAIIVLIYKRDTNLHVECSKLLLT